MMDAAAFIEYSTACSLHQFGVVHLANILECPLWVKSRHVQRTSRCPLSAKCEHEGACGNASCHSIARCVAWNCE